MELEERLRKLENECFNNKLRRQVDTHYTGQLFNYLVKSGVVDAKDLKEQIMQIGESIKKGADYDPEAVRTADEHTQKWLEHIQEQEPRQFILSGGVS